MFDIKITGLDKLQNDLEDAQRALASLDGEFATVTVNPTDPASVEEAILHMEAAIDSKVAPYASNPFVEPLVKGAKEAFRKKLLKLDESTE